MVNKAIILGNLGRDPEMRTTPNGQSLAKFSVATTRKWKDRDGNKQEATEWHNVICWGRQAEVAGQYLSKGSKVYIEGRLQTDSWDDKETGKKMYRTEIVCENFTMLGDGKKRESDYGSRSEPPAAHTPIGGAPDDDDLPF